MIKIAAITNTLYFEGNFSLNFGSKQTFYHFFCMQSLFFGVHNVVMITRNLNVLFFSTDCFEKRSIYIYFFVYSKFGISHLLFVHFNKT